MTDAELTALKALTDAATPGPWEVGEYNFVMAEGRYILKCRDQYDGVRLAIHDNADADAAFIAAARAAVPALIAEAERLQVAWSAEHDAYIRADEQARMARREVERLRAELAAARNLTMDVRRADNGDVVISVE